MERLLSEIVERLQKAHRDSLVSVVLYGSGAAPDGRDPQSDYNVLCVLREVTIADLRAAEPVFRWWREMKNPSPLLLSVEEMRNSADSFPIEFHDIRECRRVLFGDDLLAGLVIQDAYYRAQVEHELRATLLRLRQKAGGILSESDVLLRLMADSVSTVCVLIRHSLMLAGDAPKYRKRELIEAARERFGIDPVPFVTLLDLREEKIKPRAVAGVPALLDSYMKEIGAVITAVDRMGELRGS